MNNGKICVPVSAETSGKAIADARLSAEFADVVEIRIDALDPSEIGQFLSGIRSDKPLLITYRPAEQGGYREIEIEQRIKFWNELEESPLDTTRLWFDQEADLTGRMRKQDNPVSIRSFHDFDGVPDDVDSIFDRLAADGEVVKIAVTANDVADAIPVWKLLDRAKSENRQLIPIAMGEAGKWTRILGLAHGAFLTYASLDTGKETAGGQLTAKESVETYRVRELDENTQVYGIVGDPVTKSLSPKMLNPAFVSAGINAVYLHLPVKNLDEFMRRMVMPGSREVELNFAGFSVTMPHKEMIIKYLDGVDPIAEKIGAVNTVKIENGLLTGYNTDVYGFITPLKQRFGDLRDARIAIFGAGGAARACVYALKQENAEVTVFARDPVRGGAFANEFGVNFEVISDLKHESSKTEGQKPKTDLSAFDIVVDTTPLGMAGAMENESLFTSDELAGIKFVYDLVTKSVDTPIIREAKKAGIPYLGGIEMLIAQGAKQFEIWTGREAPVDVMRNSLISQMEA